MRLIHRTTGRSDAAQHLGPYQIETIIPPEDEAAGTAYRVRIEPGQRTAISYHKIAEEYYYVLAGHGVAILDGREYSLQPGDFLRLPPGCTHGFVTADEPLEMLDIHTPGCRPDRDVYFVGDVPHGFRTEE